MGCVHVYIFIEFNAWEWSARRAHWCPVALPTELETKLVELFCSITGDMLDQHLGIVLLGYLRRFTHS